MLSERGQIQNSTYCDSISVKLPRIGKHADSKQPSGGLVCVGVGGLVCAEGW